MKVPRVCIIILNWNGKELLKTCLTSLFKLTDYPNYKVIVVDNGSTDGSIEYVKKNFPKADVLALDKNYGFSKGNNEGIKYAIKKYNPEYIILLNNDIKICQKDWLLRIVKVAEDNEKIGIVGCRLVSPGKKNVEYFHGFLKPTGMKPCKDEIMQEVDWVLGALFLIKRRVVDKIGLLDEGFSPIFYEEIDYCARARAAGYKIIYNPLVTAIHLDGGTLRKVEARGYLYFVNQKNKFRFILLNYPISWILLRIPWEVGVLINSIFTGKFLPLLKAYIITLKNLMEILKKRRNRTMKIWF
jgi:GT2 family glycosyltransferase